MDKITDNELIDSILAGNIRDYSLLVKRYQVAAYNLSLRMLRNTMDAEEVVQDSFIKAYHGLVNFRREAKFSTWVYRIVYNLSLNKIQSNKSTSQLTDLYEDEIAENSITDTLCSEENSRIIERLIFSLRPTYSAVLNMFYFEHLSCEEIAEIMQIEVNNVKVLLYRSRKALRDLIIEKKLQEDII